MKYKVGDRVFIKPWKLMEKECGLYKDGDIKCKGMFTHNMEKDLMGRNRIAKISSVYRAYYGIQLDGQEFEWRYIIFDDMIAGYAFDYGEKAEFSDDEGTWQILSFWGFAPGVYYPYLAGSNAPLYGWRYARPLPKEPEIEITVKINGKEAKLSDIPDEILRKIKAKE